MRTRLASLSYYLTRLAVLVLGLMVLYFLVGSAMRLADNQKQVRRYQAAQAELRVQEARNEVLRENLEYIQSQAAVVEWARQLGLARANEVPVILIEPPEPAAAEGDDLAGVGGGGAAEDAPDSWWDLIFRR
jgi:cell division protein FtsB